ncbi:hypothetical protein PR202_ga23115 [Eleusine coracana subsp. coracana]|uniref:Uncharacterized protein n=1 Tax=Eleusine coracana subsp. coracana TaxID=191504 RepID=A0AAV5D4W0_ELECO|nr:hypothetical protein PR202_ga23115 [Eleusine coracana subsp. coracana]
MGDLNELLDGTEKLSCHAPNLNRISSFRNIIYNCGLIGLGYNGLAYTWTNRRFSSNPTFQRLDRCLANATWCNNFPNTNVYHLPIIYGDHAPILAIPLSNYVKRKRNFKFENWWLFEKDFQNVCKDTWVRYDHLSFHKRLKQLDHNLTVWSKRNKSSLNVQLKILKMIWLTFKLFL